MEKVYLIGDCQATRIYEHHDFNNKLIDLKMWAQAGYSCWLFTPEYLSENKILSSKIEHEEYPLQWPRLITFDEIKDDGLILAWFGYIDVKYLLPKWNDVDETAYQYISRLRDHFPKSKIKLIEPHPQFTETMLFPEEGWPDFDYETRQKYNKEFIDALEKYRMEFALEPSIRQADIYKASGLDVFTSNETVKFAAEPRLLDGLAPEYRIGIYNLFMKEIYNTLNIL